MFRVVERSILFFWDFNHYSTCGIGKRINSFVLGIEQSLSFFHLYLVEECSQFLYALILISAYICFKLIYVYDRSFVFFLSSWYPMWFETFYFILFLIRMVAFSVYIYLLYLLGWKSFFFLWLFIFRTSKLRNDVYACFIYCGRSSLFSTRYGFDLTYTSYLVMVGDCS